MLESMSTGSHEAMATTYREIELNIFSAHDLRDVRIFGGKMSPYVVAWVHHDLKAYSPADVKGSTDPSWHAKLLLYCNEAALDHPDEAVIYFELHDAASASDRLIGALSYPLSELPGHISSHKEPSDAVFLNLPVSPASSLLVIIPVFAPQLLLLFVVVVDEDYDVVVVSSQISHQC